MKEDLEFTPKEINTVIDMLTIFNGRLGYPSNPKAMQFAARGFLHIAHTEPRTWIAGEDEEYKPIIKTCKDPAAWLIDQVYQADIDRFPTMFQFRSLYEKRFTPRDCRYTCDVAV